MYARFVGKPEDAVRRARLGNPWWVVAGAVVGLCVCNGPVLFFTSGVFLKPIAVDMQWPRSTVSFALSLATPALTGFCVALMTAALLVICLGPYVYVPQRRAGPELVSSAVG